VKVYWRITGRK